MPTPIIPPENNTHSFRIVGIGASAGGLEAFEQFFQHLSADCGMAFVLVSHLDPSHASLLVDILQRSTALPVVEAFDQLPVAANHVYIIPPNSEMGILNGVLQITAPEQPRGQRMPIDVFLCALADDQQENAIGIIFSGTGTDGTLGCKAIIDAGGLTLVQEPDTAKYGGMPTSVIHAGYATLVLPIEKMPEVLVPGTQILATNATTDNKSKAMTGINRVLVQLRKLTGHDFTQYKKSTISRRIQRRLAYHHIKDTQLYIRYLKENPDEVRSLFKELLINVTSFFRDPEAFAVLEKEIMPQMFKDKPEGYVFRIWVASCATGEEAYSLAILFCELITNAHQEFKVQIYATDLAEDVIAIARKGVYPISIIQDLTPERLRRFFVKEEEGYYRVKKEIREMVVFAVQNVIKDPPFIKLDLLSCRNLMIYLEPELQSRLISIFYYALKVDGVLFLSPSESIGQYTDLFTPLNRKWKLFRARQTPTSCRETVAQGLTFPPPKDPIFSQISMKKMKPNTLSELTNKLLVKYFAPASVVTDLNGFILYIHGDTGKYLRPAPGLASLNIIEMAREGLKLELRTMLQAALIHGMPSLNREIQFKDNDNYTMVNLCIRLLPNPTGDQKLLLVSFQDIVKPEPKFQLKLVGKPVELDRITELELDLAQLKDYNQSIIEEQQATNEELNSTNEEIQSTNEELQSTNEELETSKEELQSVNEELITVNSELQAKIEQLDGMQDDMKNLMDNISIGIIFLDRQLVIRSFTRQAVRFYRLLATDVGRPLNDIRTVMAGEDELLSAAKSVLDTLVPYEQEMRSTDDHWVLARIQPYRTLDNMIDGVVLTFTDITDRLKVAAVEEALSLLQGIVDTVREPMLVLDGALQVVSANCSFYREFEVTPEQTLGIPISSLGNRQWDIPDLLGLLASILQKNGSM